MNNPERPFTPPTTGPQFENILIALLFLAATYVVYFAAAPTYFLYEDDYFTVGLPAAQGFHWIWKQFYFVWTTWPQGRPAMFSALALEGGVINLTGSVLAGYIPSFLIVFSNAYLVYRLFLLRFSLSASIAGALFCLLSCADPHKILLTHAPLQFAVTLNLIGLILYLNDRPILAYLVAGSSLFFYEISFGIFASAELFRQLNAKPNLKRLFLTWGLWLGMAAVVLFTRLLVGETRAMESTANLPELIHRILTNVSMGPLYALENAYAHPITQIVRHPNFWLLLIGLSAATCIGVAGFAIARRNKKAPVAGADINPFIAAAVLLLLVAGPYALQFRRTVFEGFMRPVSGYHLVMGVALGFGAALLLTFFKESRRACTGIYALLLILSFASIYQNLLIQCDYGRSARYQAHFWAETRRLSLDATPGDVIIIPRRQLLEAEYILSNSWAVTYTWMVLFEQTGPLIDWMNTATTRPVAVFIVPEDWEKQITLEADGYVLAKTEYTPAGFRQGQIPLVEGQVIVLESTWAEPFQRRSNPIAVGDHLIQLKNAGAAVRGSLKPTVVGKYLLNDFIN